MDGKYSGVRPRSYMLKFRAWVMKHRVAVCLCVQSSEFDENIVMFKCPVGEEVAAERDVAWKWIRVFG